MKSNKRIVIFIIIVIVFIGLICLFEKRDELIYSKKANIGEEFKVPLHKTVTVDNNLKVKLLSVSDSRCRDGWECIWEGELLYTISINGESIELGTVRSSTVNYKNYNVMINKDNDSTKYVLMSIGKDD